MNGAQGPRGPQGEPGAAGLSAPVRRALVFLFALAVILAGLNLTWTAYEVHASRDAIQAAQHREQLAAQQAGQAVEAKLCKSLGKLAALPPPPGDPAANPSRAWEQAFHAILDELGPDISCPGTEGSRR